MLFRKLVALGSVASAACGGRTSEDVSRGNAGAAEYGGAVVHTNAGSPAAGMGANVGNVAGIVAAGGAPLAASTGGAGVTNDCSSDVTTTLATQIRSRINSQVPCYSGIVRQSYGTRGWEVTGPTSSGDCNGPEDSPLVARVRSAIADVAAPDCVIYVSVSGGAATDLSRIWNTVWAPCIVTCAHTTFSIELDAQGNFVDVTGALEPATLDCIRSALAGLNFSCLSGTQSCEVVCE